MRPRSSPSALKHPLARAFLGGALAALAVAAPTPPLAAAGFAGEVVDEILAWLGLGGGGDRTSAPASSTPAGDPGGAPEEPGLPWGPGRWPYVIDHYYPSGLPHPVASDPFAGPPWEVPGGPPGPGPAGGAPLPVPEPGAAGLALLGAAAAALRASRRGRR